MPKENAVVAGWRQAGGSPESRLGAGLATPGWHDPWLRDGVTDCHSTRLDMYYVVGLSSDRTQVRQVDNPNK